MVDAKGFYTIKGYQIQEGAELTPAMEDYLEMICRLMETHTVVRLGELAEVLHVKPSSASKMIRLLSETGYINAEKYGYILLTEKDVWPATICSTDMTSCSVSCACSTIRTTNWSRWRKSSIFSMPEPLKILRS